MSPSRPRSTTAARTTGRTCSSGCTTSSTSSAPSTRSRRSSTRRSPRLRSKRSSPGSSPKVCCEEGEDALPGVLGGLGLVADPGDAHDRAERPWVLMAHEGMAGAWIFLDVMIDARRESSVSSSCRGTLQRAVGAAVAGNDRAGAFEVLGDARRSWAPEASKPRAAVASAKPPPMQNPTMPTLAGAVGVVGHLPARRPRSSSNCVPVARRQRPEGAEHAARGALAAVEVGRQREVAVRGAAAVCARMSSLTRRPRG